MFSRLVIIIDFLMSYADVDFIEAIDLKEIRLAPTHYIGQHGDERIVDLVFQCPLKNGDGSLMAVIIFEHVCLKQMHTGQVCIDALIYLRQRGIGRLQMTGI